MEKNVTISLYRKWSKTGKLLKIAIASCGALILAVTLWRLIPKDSYDANHLRDVIIAAANRHGVEPALVLGVVRRESNFDPNVRGRDGEYGLMQVTRIAARDWERVNHRTIRFDRDLFDPKLNVEIGTWYLARGWRKYKGNKNRTVLALSQYNAGPSRASEWSKKYKENLLERIPFSSTREYIAKVCAYRDKYRKEIKK